MKSTEEFELREEHPPLGGLDSVTVGVAALDETVAEFLADLSEVSAKSVCKTCVRGKEDH